MYIGYFHLYIITFISYNKVMNAFDPGRAEFAPYGFTCELWNPAYMRRPDRHNEIEVNFVTQGSLTYLLGGKLAEVPCGRLCVFWASIPHQIIAFTSDVPYHVLTLPLAWFLASRPPEDLLHTLLNGNMVAEPSTDRSVLDSALIQQWLIDFTDGTDVIRALALTEIEARLHRLAFQTAEVSLPRSHESEQAVINSTTSRNVEEITRYIAGNYTSAITVKSIAESVGLHPNYAMELF